jgi:membrane protein
VKLADPVMGRADRWQRSHPIPAVLYAVNKKFGDDKANQYVVGLGWYGFMAIFPLLLVAVTIFGFIGGRSLGQHLVATLHQFPVVGSEFNPAHASQSLHGSVIGLVIGLVALVYGAQGVTQTAQQAMVQVWNIPQLDVPGFVARLGRSLAGLAIIGGSFLVNAALATFATGGGRSDLVRIPVLVGMVLVNVALYVAAFRALTPSAVPVRALVPGSAVAAVGFTVLITLGSGLVQHQVRNSSSTYGQFGVVIGLVAFLFLLAKISLYGAELNPVLTRKLWPRALQSSRPTEADDQVLRDLAHQSRRRKDQRILVGFGEEATAQIAGDAAASYPASTGQDPDAGEAPDRRRPAEPAGHRR